MFHFASQYSTGAHSAHTQQQKWLITGDFREGSQSVYGGSAWTVGGKEGSGRRNSRTDILEKLFWHAPAKPGTNL